MFLLWHPSLTAINLSYTFPILETSATALCGTTGIHTHLHLHVAYTYIHTHTSYTYTPTHIITSQRFSPSTVPRSESPLKALAESNEILGKVLAVPMPEDPVKECQPSKIVALYKVVRARVGVIHRPDLGMCEGWVDEVVIVLIL